MQKEGSVAVEQASVTRFPPLLGGSGGAGGANYTETIIAYITLCFYIVYYGLIGKRYFGPRRRCVSYMEFAPLAPPLYFGIQTMPHSCRRSSTLRSDSGKRTYSITANRMISGLVLKYLNGERFVMRRGYGTARPVSSSFCLTVPNHLLSGPNYLDRGTRTSGKSYLFSDF